MADSGLGGSDDATHVMASLIAALALRHSGEHNGTRRFAAQCQRLLRFVATHLDALELALQAAAWPILQAIRDDTSLHRD